MVKLLIKIISAAVMAALVYTVFVVSGGYVHSTVTAGEEYFTILCVAVSAVALLLLFFNRNIKLTIPDVVAAAFVAYTIANYHAKGGIDDYKLTMFVLSWVLYFCARVIMTYYKGVLDWLVLFVLVSGITQAMIGIGQIYGLEYSYHSLFKTTGTFFNPGPYAGYLAVSFAIALGTIANNHMAQRSLFDFKLIRSNYKRLLNVVSINYAASWVAVMAIFIILPATMSRAAWVAAIAAVLAATGWYFDLPGKLKRYYRTHKRKATASLAVVCVCAAFLATGLYIMKKGSADGRVFMWRMTAAIIGENAVAGVGTGNFGGTYADVQSRYFERGEYTEHEVNAAGNPQYVFNEYLRVFAEGGLIAFTLFLAIVAIAVYALLHSRKDMAFGLMALLVFAAFSYPLSIMPITILFILFIAAGGDILPIAGRRASVVGFGFICVTAVIFTLYNARESKEVYTALREWNLVRPIYKMQLYDDIAEDYEELYPQLKYESEFLFEYGHSLNKTGNYSLSNKILERGAKINSDPMFYNIMGNNYKNMGDIVRAESAYLKSYHITPARIYPLYLLTKMYDDIGDAEKAVSAARLFLSVTPKVVSSATKDMTEEIRGILNRRAFPQP